MPDGSDPGRGEQYTERQVERVRRCVRDANRADILQTTDDLRELCEGLAVSSSSSRTSFGTPSSTAAGTSRSGSACSPTTGGFYVADDGPGIPASDREELFQPGFTTKQDGTGFGLATVKQLADAHGWTVEIADSDEGGARFEITVRESV